MTDKDGNIIPHNAPRDLAFRDGDAPDPDPDAPFEWCLHIGKVENGFVANGMDGTMVFEESESAGDTDPLMMQKLLYYVISYFGEDGGRYDPARIRVNIEPGDKYEGPTTPN